MQKPVETTAPVARIHSSPSAIKLEVQRLLPAIKAAAAETERARRVPDAHVEALRDIGFFKLVQPAAFGGDEHDFVVLAELIMEIAQACASTAWVCGLLAAHQWMLGLFAAEAQSDVWAQNPDALLCGSYAPACSAVANTGGYRISGRWSFASGCDNSQWAFCAARLPPKTEQGAGEPAFLLVPCTDYTIDDTWDTIGLAGTGSKTLVLDNVFVPQHRLLMFADAAAGRSPGGRLYQNRLFAIPIYCQLSPCLAAAAVGAAAGALADFTAATSQRLTRGSVTGGNNRMAEFPTIQIKVAEAAASIDAARFILLRDFEAIAREVREGEASVERRVTNRRGQAFAVNLAVRATEVLNAATGGNGLAMSNPIQRAWRDANAVGRHVSLNWDSVGAMYGQMALGLEPRGQY
jgi:alkylation response protein AidB-like acyl-CoA dehydrogenase